MRCTCEWRGGNQMDGLPITIFLLPSIFCVFSHCQHLSAAPTGCFDLSKIASGERLTAIRVDLQQISDEMREREQECPRICACVCVGVRSCSQTNDVRRPRASSKPGLRMSLVHILCSACLKMMSAQASRIRPGGNHGGPHTASRCPQGILCTEHAGKGRSCVNRTHAHAQTGRRKHTHVHAHTHTSTQRTLRGK